MAFYSSKYFARKKLNINHMAAAGTGPAWESMLGLAMAFLVGYHFYAYFAGLPVNDGGDLQSAAPAGIAAGIVYLISGIRLHRFLQKGQQAGNLKDKFYAAVRISLYTLAAGVILNFVFFPPESSYYPTLLPNLAIGIALSSMLFLVSGGDWRWLGLFAILGMRLSCLINLPFIKAVFFVLAGMLIDRSANYLSGHKKYRLFLGFARLGGLIAVGGYQFGIFPIAVVGLALLGASLVGKGRRNCFGFITGYMGRSAFFYYTFHVVILGLLINK